jgi:1-acyl-sn-glycerol-3-phosphate acyltransferase
MNDRHAFATPRSLRPTDSSMRRAMTAMTDRLVEFTADTLGVDIDECLGQAMAEQRENDPFGTDWETIRFSLALIAYMYRGYFRTEVHGIENVPAGRVMLIGNHSGQIPLDGVAVIAAMAIDGKPPRFVRGMVERFIGTLPFASIWFPRVGQVLGAPENARLLLEQDQALVVFPEGARGISKPISQRYQLVDFGLGFMRLALETKTPIVPVAVIGAEEQLISVTDLKPLAKALGMPSFPIIPQLLMGMPFPLPTKYRIYFGEPLTFTGDPDDDDAVIEEKVWVVRTTIQSMVNRGLRERQAIFW